MTRDEGRHMPYDRERLGKELEVLMTQVLQLRAELGKKKDDAFNKKRISKKLEAISEQSLQLLTALGMEKDEVIRQIEETIVKKNQVERFKRYSGELSKFFANGFKVVTAPTQDEMIRQLFTVVEHAEGLWNDATLLFKEEKYPTACFLSLVCIEECAKINFGMFQVYSSFFDNRKTSIKNSQPSANARRRSPLSSHVRKHFVAACSGALVNSRMDRVFGMEKVNSFISDCEKGKLEKLRQSCLYTDIDESRQRVLLPMEQIAREQALFYVCLAGEILAEAGGIEPSTCKRLLDKVDKFEKENEISTNI